MKTTATSSFDGGPAPFDGLEVDVALRERAPDGAMGCAANDGRVGYQERIGEGVMGLDEDDGDAFVRRHAPRLSGETHDRIWYGTTRHEQRGIGTLAAAHPECHHPQ